jgi:hypothetical protein
MISPGPDKDSNHPATPPMPTAAPPALVLDLFDSVERLSEQAASVSFALSRACRDPQQLRDLQSVCPDRLQAAVCLLETAATHLHHITQR